jgi:diacylglycerol kinase (ATP)
LKFFINVADIGMGPEVVQRVSRASKVLGSALGYSLSILKTFARYRLVNVTARTNNWEWSGKLRSLAIANGKYYGHGLCIAPDAKVDDDKLDVFICGDVSVVDFIIQSENLKKGKFLSLPDVKYTHASEVFLTCDERCLIEGDGEVFGTLPATVRLSDRSVRMLLP